MTAPLPDEARARLAEHVVDRDGLVWRVVRDGGIATRATYSGIASIGIAALEREHGPLVTVADLIAEATAERDATLDRVRALATLQAIACQAAHRADHARNWLDVLAILDGDPE